MIINIILITNGVYDIACAASILWLNDLPLFSTLAKLHPTMFNSLQHSEHPVIKRLLSYSLDVATAMTYFIEAFCFEYESRVGQTMDSSKVAFVSIVSTIMGILFLLRPFGVYDNHIKKS